MFLTAFTVLPTGVLFWLQGSLEKGFEGGSALPIPDPSQLESWYF